MINIDFLTLRAFFLENIDFFIGARLQKIQQPTRRDFVLTLRNNGESRKLYININPQIYHICFMSESGEKRRGLAIPKKPPMFCMLLRKYLEGCKVSDAVVIKNERIIEFHFETMDELSQNRSLALCIELMGKHSNVILYDRETSLIIGCAHNVGSEKSRYRELQGGLRYVLPPTSGVSMSNEMKIQFSGVNEGKINEYLNSETFRPALKEDRYTLFAELVEGAVRVDSVNAMLDEYYSKIQNDINMSAIRSKLGMNVEQKLKKVNGSISKISNLLNKRDKADLYRHWGELLTANLYQNKNYSKRIEVYDYVNEQEITIELDETMTLNENAQRYFKLYTKAKTTKEKSEKMLEGLNIEKEYLENLLYSINTAENIDDFDEITAELGLSEVKSKKQEKSSVMRFEISGFDVYVGKNNKQNDYIVSKLAKDEDYWFHTRLCAGSHLLLKTNGQVPREEVLFECCKLARKYSSAAQPSKVAVIYTKAKYLKKPPASPLGYVIYKNEKEVLV